MTAQDSAQDLRTPAKEDLGAGQHSHRRRMVRAAKRVAFGLLVLLSFGAGVLLFSDSLAAMLLRKGVESYARSVPGDVRVGAIEGNLWSGLELTDLTLADGQGTELFHATSVELGVDLAPIFRGQVRARGLKVGGASLYLPGESAAGFADLVPPDEGASEPPNVSSPLGPALPIDLDAELQIQDLTIYQGPPGHREVLLELETLNTRLAGGERHLGIALDLKAAVPTQKIQIDDFSLRARWDAGRLSLDRLRLSSNWGSFDLAPSEVDFAGTLATARRAPSGTLGEFNLIALREVVRAQTGLQGDSPARLQLSASSANDVVNSTMTVALPGAIDARFETRAVLGDAPSLEVRGDIELRLGGLSAEFADRKVHLKTRLELKPEPSTSAPGDAYALVADLRCDDCDPASTPMHIASRLSFSPRARSASVHARASVSDTSIELNADVDPKGEFDAKLEVQAGNLAGIWKVANTIVPLPRFGGAAEVELRCSGQLEPAKGSCTTQIRLDHGQPVSHLRLSAKATYGPVVVLEISELEVGASGVDLHLTHGPAQIRYDVQDEAISVAGVQIDLSRRGIAGGRIKLNGNWPVAVRPKGQGESLQRVDASIEGLNLHALDTVVPGLGLGGRLDARVRLEGSAAQPRFSAVLNTRALRYRQHRLGELHVSADYATGQGRTRIRYAGAFARSLQVDAKLPLNLTLDGQPPRLRGNEAVQLALELDGLQLKQVLQTARLEVKLDALAHARVDIGGTLDRPRLEFDANAERILFQERPLGELSASGSLRAGLFTADLDWKYELWRRLHLRVNTRVGVDASRGHFKLRPRSTDGLDLAIEGLELKRLRAVDLPALASLPVLGGRVDLNVALRSPWIEPELQGQLVGTDLRVNDHRLGRLETTLDYAGQLASARVSLRGPDIGLAVATARVPLRVSLRRPKFVWQHQLSHDLELVVSGADLRGIDRWSRTKLFLSGHADLSASLHGAPHDPRLELDLGVEALAYGEEVLGDLSVQAGFGAPPQGISTALGDARSAQAELSLVQGADRKLDLSATVPLAVDLLAVLDSPDAAVRWSQQRRHRLRLVAPHIDDALLAPIMQIPDGLTFDIGTEIDLEGSPEQFEARWLAEGHAVQQGRHIPLALSLDAGAGAQHLELLIGDTRHPWLSLQAETRAQIAKLLDGSAKVADVGLEASLESREFDLAQLNALLPPELQSLVGEANVLAALTGSMSKPTLSGSAELRGGGFTVVPLRQRFTDLAVSIDLKRDRLTLRELSVKSGRGTLRGSGEARLLEGKALDLQIHLDGRALPIRRPGLPRMKLSAQIDTSASLSAAGSELDVAIESLRVDIQKGNVSAPAEIPSHDGVYFVSLNPDGAAWAGDSPASASRPQENERAKGPPFALEVRLLEPARIMGPGVDMSWVGAVAARSSKDEVTAEGALKSTDGQFNFLGNSFTISEGNLRLPESGGLIPYIDVKANTSVGSIKISATVRGPVDRATLTLSSQPAHSESDIFTMLVTGSPDVDSADPEEVKARAASVLTALASPGLRAELNQSLKLDKIGLTFGDSTDQPILSVGKQLSKRVSAESQYHFNAPPNRNRGQVSLRYRFAPRWSLEAFLGDAAVGGADIFWSIAFDGGLSSALGGKKASPPEEQGERGKQGEQGEQVNEASPDVVIGDPVPAPE